MGLCYSSQQRRMAIQPSPSSESLDKAFYALQYEDPARELVDSLESLDPLDTRLHRIISLKPKQSNTYGNQSI